MNRNIFLFRQAHDLHARFKARPGKNTERKRCSFCPFVRNDLVLSLLSLKSPFRPVLWPFCPLLCPFCPLHKRLKFAGTVLFLLRPWTVNMTKHMCHDCPIPNCGARYLVRLFNHLTDVHGLDYINPLTPGTFGKKCIFWTFWWFATQQLAFLATSIVF